MLRRPGYFSRRARVGLFVAGTILLGAAGTLLTASPAIADSPGPLVVDYQNYPPPLPAGCPDGTGALSGVGFDNGHGQQSADLRQLTLAAGDTLTMSWTGYNGACAKADGAGAIDVSLVANGSQSAQFDVGTDQKLVNSVTCGPDAGACQRVGERWTLALKVPGPDQACNYQVEAVLGRPLAVVGPSGSYYNSLLRGGTGPNMLVSATNFEIPGCVAGVQANAAAAQPAVTTTAAPAPTTTAPPQPAAAAAVESAVVAAAPTAAPTTTAVPTQVEAAVAARALPNTGAHTAATTTAGLMLLMAGAGLLGLAALASRRTHEQPAVEATKH